MTLTELLISTMLLAVSMGAIGELVYMNTYASTKVTNGVDGQVGCSRAIRRISRDIRAARIIGNIFGGQFWPNTSLGSNDPANGAIPGGAPGSPWPAAPYQLSPQTLIVQLPVYYEDPNSLVFPYPTNNMNGVPLMQQGSTSLVECVDTVIYQVVPDAANPPTFMLQVARFPGTPAPSSLAAPALRPPINPPETILKGIIGPLNAADGAGAPAVFEFLPSAQSTFSAVQILDATLAGGTVPTSNIVGVSRNLEVQTPPSGYGTNVRKAAAHVESYLRAAQNLRMTNQ